MKAFVVRIDLSDDQVLPTPSHDEDIVFQFLTESAINKKIKANQIKDMGFLSAWALYKTQATPAS
jgi:hypothetical protein